MRFTVDQKKRTNRGIPVFAFSQDIYKKSLTVFLFLSDFGNLDFDAQFLGCLYTIFQVMKEEPWTPKLKLIIFVVFEDRF